MPDTRRCYCVSYTIARNIQRAKADQRLVTRANDTRAAQTDDDWVEVNKSEAIQPAEAAADGGEQAEPRGSEGGGSTDGADGTHETPQEEPIRVAAAVAALLVRLSSDAAQVWRRRAHHCAQP